ncbi:MAG: aldo/keto reductase [archaeon]|nr:aldo/keto reductase [archaeon]
MPLLGLGTWEARGEEAKLAVKYAIEKGYRLIDTASFYGNEHEVGAGIKESKTKRKEIFLTTKLWNSEHDNVKAALGASLSRLGLDYVDLYLIHWPVSKKRISTWKEFERLDSKKVRGIGVSNFTKRHLTELLKHAKIVPCVNQVEFHPYLYQKELLEFCTKNEIQLEAYSPLGRGAILRDRKIREIGENHSKTPAQIVLRWHLQHGVIPIPKTVRKERLEENASIFDFELSEAQMRSIDSLERSRHFVSDPEKYA